MFAKLIPWAATWFLESSPEPAIDGKLSMAVMWKSDVGLDAAPGNLQINAQRPLDRRCDIANIANMTEKQPVSSILRAIRANLNLTQEQLAERLGVSFATV